MTPTASVRLHPWLPVLLDADGHARLRLDQRSRPLPPELTAAVTASARRLRSTQCPGDDGPGWRTLLAAGHVVDCAELARSAAVGGDVLARAHLSRHAVSAAAAGRVRRRADQRVAVTGPGVITDSLQAALAACGVPSSGPGVAPTMVVHVGRPNASTIHEWMLTGVTHLVVAPRAAAIRVGPLIVPGASACLQCLSLARGDGDAAWPLLAERLTRLPVPTPDGVLVGQASALAARAVVDFAETGSCDLLGAYRVIDLEDVVPRRATVARHPNCGCWWPVPPHSASGPVSGTRTMPPSGPH